MKHGQLLTLGIVFVSVLCVPAIAAPRASRRVKPAPHAKTKAIQQPQLGFTSKAADFDRFVAYFQKHGYTITTRRQEFKPDGTVRLFTLRATRPAGTLRKTDLPSQLSEDINAAAGTELMNITSGSTSTFEANPQ